MSPRQNRVTPGGEIVAIPLRGAWMGNRGILHDDAGRVARNHASSLWITCLLAFGDQRAAQWEPHHYTVLFFLDEAVSFAAGHRPCAWCRRGDYNAYRDAIARLERAAPLPAKEMDTQLHAQRLVPRTRTRRLHELPWPEVPAGAFVLHDGAPHLVRPTALVPWTVDGYAAPERRPRLGTASVLTPPLSLAAFREGYIPQVDAAAHGQ